MTGLTKKSAIIGLTSLVSLVFLFSSPIRTYAKEDKPSKPSIKVVEKKSTSIVIRVKRGSLANKKVTINVSVERMNGKNKFERTFKVKLNGDGVKRIKVSGLERATEYKFKAQIKKRNQGEYSDFSSVINASTKK